MPRLLRLLSLIALACLTAAGAPAVVAAQPSADLGLVNQSDSPDPAATGDTVTYWVGIQNNGPDPATGVRLEVTFPEGIRFDPTRSSANCTQSGSTVTCSYDSWPADATGMVPISATAVAAGSHVVTFTISANERDRHMGNNTVTETTTVVEPTTADVSIELQDTTARDDEPFFWSYGVFNAGPATATGIVATLTLPDGIVVLDDGSGSCSSSAQTLTCQIGSLSPGTGVASILQLQASAPGTYTISGMATADQPDPNTANNTDPGTIVVASTDADLAVDVPPSTTARAGEPFSFPVTVSNAGPAGATAVTATVQLPSGVDYVGGDCTADGSVVTCSFGSVAAGSSETATLQLSTVNAGTYTISASVDATEPDPATSNNEDSGQVSVQPSADIAVSIVESADPVKPGQGVTYTATVANQGPSSATGVTLSLAWATTSSRGVSVESSSSTQGTCVQTDARLDCDLGALGPGETATVSVTLKPRGKGTITITGNADAAEFDPNTANNADTETTGVGPG